MPNNIDVIITIGLFIANLYIYYQIGYIMGKLAENQRVNEFIKSLEESWRKK